jgi:ABC-type nitrate/sulfonate/bicarbonate transport system substrate-binding protein
VKTDSPIKSYKDFKGKTIGVFGLNSSNEVLARAAIDFAGGNPKTDVKIVPLAGSAMIPAILSGQVDIAMGIEPYMSQELAKGDIRKVGSLVDVFNTLTHIPYFAGLDVDFGTNFIAQNTGAVCAFLSDFRSGIKWAKANMTTFRQGEIDQNYIPGPVDPTQTPARGMPDNGAVDLASDKAMADLGVKYGIVSGPLDWSKYVSPLAITH